MVVKVYLKRGTNGRAVQVDPMKPTLKAPGTKPLKLEHDEPLSSFAFKINLCHYTTGAASPPRTSRQARTPGAYSRSLFSST